MKRLLSILAGLLVAVGAIAAEPGMVQFTAKACETNAAAQTTYTPDTDMIMGGWVDTIIVDQTGTATGTVSLATLASDGTGAARSILLDTTVSADGSYPVRDLGTTQAGADITGVGARIPLAGNKLRLTLYNWGATNISMTVYVLTSDNP